MKSFSDSTRLARFRLYGTTAPLGKFPPGHVPKARLDLFLGDGSVAANRDAILKAIAEVEGSIMPRHEVTKDKAPISGASPYSF